MSEPGKAVFLSYASQDAEAATRICDALRAAGVEVWFDQSELVGGDAWDQKIRRQIKECALLIPIISANTQARTEGYFRLEWRLADQRTHLMAKGRPYLLPLVIDGTRDADAHVPDSFTEVQWTKASGGTVPAAFGARVKRLLDGEPAGAALRRDGTEESRPEAALTMIRTPRWMKPVLAGAGLIVIALAVTLWQRSKREASAVLPPTQAAETPAARTVTRVTTMLNAIDVTRAELDLAGDLLEQAVKSDPADAKLYATWAMLDCRYLTECYDRSPTRLDAARQHAAQAGSLDGGDPLVRMARAFTMQQVNDNPATRAQAAALLESVRTELPGDPRVLQQLGWAVAWAENGQAAAEGWWAQQAKLPGQAAAAAFNRGLRGAWVGDFRAGYAAMAEADALAKSTKVKLWKSYLEVVWLGDLAAAKRTMAEVPVEAFVEDMPATARNFVAYWARDFELALEASRAVPREFLQSIAGTSPAGYLRGMALARLGRTAAAENEWRAALAATERRLATEPNDHSLLLAKGLLLVALGDKPAAAQVRRMAIELYGESIGEWSEEDLAAEVLPPEEAISRIQDITRHYRGRITAATLRLNPYYDRFRENPRFVALQAEADANPALSPMAPVVKSAANAPPSTPVVAPDAKSVAVLAFANLSDDKNNEYFSDGISEELLNVLAKIPELKVAARTSAFYFKDKEVPVPEIARQLGVAYVVEGSVRKSGDRVRITAQLIKAADGFHVWSDTFTRDLKDIFGVQDEIAGLIAKNLALKMGMNQATARPAVGPEAYQEFLLGRAAAAKASMADLHEAVSHFERAVALEPNYVAAWVQLASAHTQLGRWGGAPTLQAWQAARAAIDRARALEPDSPEVLLALGWILRTSDWDWRGAERAFRRSLELRPNQPDALAGLAVLLFNVGQTDEAFRLGQQAAQLDPLNPATQIDLSIMFYLSYNWAEAERCARRGLQLAPEGTSYHSVLAWSLIAQQRYDEAQAEAVQDADQVERPTALGFLAIARGQGAAAREQLARLEELARTRGDSADLQQSIAWLSANLGEKDRAFAALDKARSTRDPSMSWLRNSWYLKPLYSDPRWSVLMHQVGLADDQLK